MESRFPTRQSGPFKYDVYLGFGFLDLTKLNLLRDKLEQRFNVVCYPKYDAALYQRSTKSAIVEGVARSKKCLLYVSESFIGDPWYRFEVAEVLHKAKRFSRDMVLVLKDPRLADVDMPPELKEYASVTCAVHDDSTLENPEFLRRLTASLLTEPNPALSVMPKENIGYGSALGYFYGYLRLVLPEFQKRLEEDTLAGSSELLQRTVRKMLIIMPESCFCPPQFSVDGQIEHTDKYVVRAAHRAGNKYRDYKSSLYKIIDQSTGEEYYFVGELATPLLTMFETYYYGLAGMTRDQLFTERDCFYFALDAILSHPDNRTCNGQYKLLYWNNDPGMKSSNPIQFYDFILPEIRKELEEAAVVSGGKVRDLLQSDDPAQDLVPTTTDVTTFESVDVRGANPAALYESVSAYKMTSEPRGRCLIINIANFDKAANPLAARPGADRDAECLKEVFEELKFAVEVHNDLTMDTLESLLLTVSAIDHSDYDAFVCCFLTHGKLGVLYTSDAKPVRILDVVEYFDDLHCETLRGKPKMFFIQACQSGNENGSPVQSRSSSPPRQTSMQSDEAQQSQPIDASDDSQTAAVNGVHHHLTGSGPESAMEMEASTLDWDANVAPTLETADSKTWAEGKATLVPGRPDFLMSYATLPGAKAYRDREFGTLYVNQLAVCLRQRHEIDRALKLVTRGVREELRERDIEDCVSRFQQPFHLTSGMDKLIKL